MGDGDEQWLCGFVIMQLVDKATNSMGSRVASICFGFTKLVGRRLCAVLRNWIWIRRRQLNAVGIRYHWNALLFSISEFRSPKSLWPIVNFNKHLVRNELRMHSISNMLECTSEYTCAECRMAGSAHCHTIIASYLWYCKTDAIIIRKNQFFSTMQKPTHYGLSLKLRRRSHTHTLNTKVKRVQIEAPPQFAHFAKEMKNYMNELISHKTVEFSSAVTTTKWIVRKRKTKMK